MRIRSNYPTPIDGISTVNPINRGSSAGEEQINMRSNPVAKLTRRPSLDRVGILTGLGNDDVIRVHKYKRRGDFFEIFRVNVGEPLSVGSFAIYKNGVPATVTTSQDIYPYLASGSGEWTFTTVNDTTFISNKDVPVKRASNESTQAFWDNNGWPNAVHINILDALNYGEKLEVVLDEVSTQQSNVLTPHTATVEIDSDPDNYEEADKVRGTGAVAIALAAEINLSAYYRAKAKGSCVSVSVVGGGLNEFNRNNMPLEGTIKSGQGDSSVKIFNRAASSPEGLPLYARIGTVVKIKSNVISDSGVYYLEAQPVSGDTNFDFFYSETTDEPQEVTWVETCVRPRSEFDQERKRLDAATMPVSFVYDQETDAFTCSFTTWDKREVGDNKTVPFPEFVGSRILSMTYFQKRLVFLTEDEVYMSETDNLFNWFKKSATSLLVTDPVSIASSSSGVDSLAHILPHNKDLLIVASDSQYKISGTEAVTPRNVSMPLSTRIDCKVNVEPVSIGSTVYIPNSYGNSAGLLAYEGLVNTDNKDVGVSVTHHVIGYLKGEIDNMAASPNLDMVVVSVSGEEDNILFIYERELIDGKLAQSAWSKWVLPENTKVRDFYFEEERLVLYCASETTGSKLVKKYIDMYSEKEAGLIYLDDRFEARGTQVTGLTAQGVDVFVEIDVPSGYTTTSDLVVVRTEGNPIAVDFVLEGNTIKITEDIEELDFYVGKTYRSSYVPTRPYIRDKEGKAEEDFRLRINRYIATVRDSGPVMFSIKSEIASYPDQENSGRVMGSSLNRVGFEDLFSGELKYSYKQNADTALAEFYTDTHLPMTIAAIRWEGQYNERGKRI